MRVTLADSIVQVDGWLPELDVIGEYKLKVRKTPAELRAERELLRQRGKTYKPSNIRQIPSTVIEHDDKEPSTVYFLPGLWPRVRDELDRRGIKYELEDKRNPDIRPELDMSAFADVEFRGNQAEAIATIANADCGIIDSPTGSGKCHHGDTPIIMYDGSIKKARDIQVGDRLMGDDSTPRLVTSVSKGHGPMYRFVPVKGDEYIFNDKHMLSLVVSGTNTSVIINGNRYKGGDIVDVAIEDYLRLNNNCKHLLKAYRSNGVDFPPIQEPKLDPYFVGVYLGDGTEHFGQITTPDIEILDYCEAYAKSLGWKACRKLSTSDCPCLVLTAGDRHICKNSAPILSIRRACGIANNNKARRIIPEYKYGTREVRLQLLAGLLDTDGHLSIGAEYEISTKWDTLAEDILFVARSLGLRAIDSYVQKCCTNTGAIGWYHRIHISGDCSIIPVKVTRKKASERKQIKDVTRTGFKLERIQDDDYYGFTVDKNHRYLLGDFTVTHNSFIVSMLCKAYPNLNIVITTSSAQVVATLYQYLCKQIPGEVGVKYANRDTTAGKRVVVVTLASLSNINPENVHLVLVDECHNVGHNVAGDELMKFCWARRFGFSASPVRNSGDGLMMEALLGPVIFKVEYQDAVDNGMVTPIKYLMLKCNDCPPAAKNPDLPDVTMKRLAYWSNRSRNMVIRDFVYRLKQVYDGQVLIYAATLEHAIRLNMLLPWFLVAYSGKTNLNDIASKFARIPGFDIARYKLSNKQLDIMRNAFSKGKLKYVICSPTWRQGVDFPNLACLIRADGDTSGISGTQIPGRLARLADGKECAYLVDIDDTFSPWAKKRAQAREEYYIGKHWEKLTYGDLLNDIGR